MKQWYLFIAFFRVGMLGYGGGPSSIPLVHKEVVEKYKWMSDEEFGDVLALANTLPGPIATKMAGYIGYKVAGYAGLVNALLASIIPTIFLMILVLTSLSAYKDQPWVLGMTKAVVPVVAVMLAVLTWQFYKNGQKGLGWKVNLVLVIASLVIMEVLGLHPGILIAALLAWALFSPVKQKQKDKSAKEVAAAAERKMV
ncbi:chromate transporter [Peribacillus deserti]|uniref:Chromate transporter n=1 Tax=Peribacillus deserti TaxID=673318 RepID=A0ABS2QJ08_9BACI|nr:chromate transporter [Peribacillus deserti]MBM7693133.1 chromate transporter [Peribacillus deserti]